MSINFLTVDPGISGTGWALFSGRKLEKWGVVRGKGIAWIEKANNIAKDMGWIKAPYLSFTLKVFIEWPSFQSLVGVNTQSINKLCFLIGRLYHTADTLIPVSKWRGTCPKEVLWRRAEKYFGIKQGILKNHEGDSVAMGQWLIEQKIVDINK